MSLKWLDVARRVQAIAQTGLHYTEGKYDKDRYEELYELSLKMLEEWSDTEITKARAFFDNDEGYRTPKVDIRSVVFKGDKILMVREEQDGKWSLPGGWADVNYSPRETAVKETREEAGLEVEAVRLLGVFDKLKHSHPPDPVHAYKLFVLCKKVGGQLQTGMETLGVGFFGKNELPELSTDRVTREQVLLMFEYRQNPEKEIWLD